jgi:hypothetical protein
MYPLWLSLNIVIINDNDNIIKSIGQIDVPALGYDDIRR